MTRQRQLIYDILAAEPIHRTAEEIYALARERMPSIARGTVYRNLGLMTEAGEIGRLEMPGMPTRYDRSPLSHPHRQCPVCGRVEDLCAGADFAADLSERFACRAEGYDLRLYVRCDGCV